ncbi:multidrug resistance efflux pump [Neorhizobium galegae]|uniref:hypothetical protein n=1 Tax=Neorhizobium galegae TaxID=399 RepID=UPI001AE417F0|nr:hypothetical protein [Neorhizobium galegae]MBP2563318.1 multidrug resistance efflux pump [Neorhizobium galegae]
MVAEGDPMFFLNAFEIQRDTFKLSQELALLALTEKRLDAAYLDQLIFAPLKAAIELAESDRDAANEELQFIQMEVDAGAASKMDLDRATARLAEMEVAFYKAKTESIQKSIDVEAELRRLDADKKDLNERLKLNAAIADMFRYRAQIAGKVEYHSYPGAFVEKGDAICTITA